MVLDTEFECSVKYQILVIKGKFLDFLGQIWSKIVQNYPKWSKIHYRAKRAWQDYFSTQFEELSLILYRKLKKLLSKQTSCLILLNILMADDFDIATLTLLWFADLN